MIPARDDEKSVIRSPSEKAAIQRILEKLVVRLDQAMEKSEPMPSAETSAIYAKRREKKSRKEGKFA